MKSAASRPGHRHGVLGGFLIGALGAALVLLPVLLGGNRAWLLGPMAGLVWLALLAWAASALWQPEQAGLARWRTARLGGGPGAWLPLLLLGLLAALVMAQLLAPALPAGAAGQPVWLPGTVDSYQTRDHLLRVLLYTGAFWLVLAVADTERRVPWVLGLVVAGGLVQALLAVVLGTLDHRYTWLHTVFQPGNRATGTFPNPDHLAGYMELGLSAGLGLMVAQMGDDGTAQRQHWRQHLLGLLQFVLSPKMGLRLLLVLMVIALVMTHSRMGNGAFFISLVLVGLLVAWRSRKLRRPALWLVASMVVVDIFIIGQLVGLDRVVTRLQGTEMLEQVDDGLPAAPGAAPVRREETLEERLRAPLIALRVAQMRPVWGFGGGTLATTFPMVRSQEVYWGYFDHAHNDYFQQAAEVGLVGLALWLGVGLAAGWRAWRLLGDEQPRLSRGVAVGTLMALACIGLHSWVDFNLQIPANAFTFSVLLALPFAVPLVRTAAARPGGGGSPVVAAAPVPAWATRALAGGLVVAGSWVAWQVGSTVPADFAAASVRDMLLKEDHRVGRLTPEAFEATRTQLEKALAHAPQAPTLHLRLGLLHMTAARAPFNRTAADAPARAQAHYRLAGQHFEQVTRLRPNDPVGWTSLADAQFAQAQTDTAWATWRQARKLGPHEGGMKDLGLEYALADWARAPADVKTWAAQVYESAGAEDRSEMDELAAEHGLKFVED